MAIACAYCGGTHERPADVRRCWSERGEPEVGVDAPDAAADGDPHVPADGRAADGRGPEAIPPPLDERGRALGGDGRGPGRGPRAGAPARHVAPRELERAVATASAGPDRLGRHAVVAPDQDAPPPWSGAERVAVTRGATAEPMALLDRLRRAASTSERLVLELHLAVDAGRVPRLMTDAEPFEAGADFAFVGDELHHLLWANSIDLRDGGAAWDALDLAVAQGLAPVAAGSPGDVTLDDGTAVWLDAGPLRHVEPIDGVPVVHVVGVEHGAPAVPGANVSTADLAPDQLAAVTHPGGAARIIAPAGSGKTRVLTERARHLLRTWRLPSSAVSLVAFNKRAQEEMRERTPDLPDLHVRTLNSIALAIVNGTAPFAPQPTRWRTIDEVEVRRLIGDLVSFPRRRNSDPVAPWIEALSLVRLGLRPPEEVEAAGDGDLEGFAEFWPAYRAALERRGAVDFDDQIHRALLVLLSDPASRHAAQRACRAMLVDEFQDLTPAHLLLIRLLSSPGGAVFGVGDDDQTIYGYNGADPGWLIDFAELFPGAGAHPLEVNYRCPGGVVEVADRLLRHNRRRVEKVIRAASGDDGGWSVATSADPVADAVEAVRAALSAGASPAEVAVLTRVNAVLAPVQVALVGEGIPVAGGVGLEFADRTAVRAVLAWLRLASTGERGRFAPADLGEAIRRPSRSFHPRITSWIAEQGSVVDLYGLADRLNNERDAERLSEFAADIGRLAGARRRCPTGGARPAAVAAAGEGGHRRRARRVLRPPPRAPRAGRADGAPAARLDGVVRPAVRRRLPRAGPLVLLRRHRPPRPRARVPLDRALRPRGLRRRRGGGPRRARHRLGHRRRLLDGRADLAAPRAPPPGPRRRADPAGDGARVARHPARAPDLAPPARARLRPALVEPAARPAHGVRAPDRRRVRARPVPGVVRRRDDAQRVAHHDRGGQGAQPPRRPRLGVGPRRPGRLADLDR